MRKLPSHIFEHPGIHSLVVPYHPWNDFYYSGHIGTCMILTQEYRFNGWIRMSYFSMLTLITNWIMMTLTGNHYVIDLITGLIVSHYMHMMCERLSFLVDEKIFRIPGYKRCHKYFEPCEKCGWSNRKAESYMSSGEEKEIRSMKDENLISEGDLFGDLVE